MSSSLSRSTIEVLQLSCSEFLAASCSRCAVTSTVAAGGFDEIFAPPDEELAVVPGLREAEFSSSTELRRVADEPSRDADLGGADCVGVRCCTVVVGRAPPISRAAELGSVHRGKSRVLDGTNPCEVQIKE